VQDNLRFVAALRKFAAYERALDSLPRPTLVTCKSNRRATCVQDVYNAVKNGVTIDQLIKHSIAPWHGTPGMLHWATTVLNAYEKQRSSGLLVRQLFEKESSTYTYLLADRATKQAILIDPVLETVERDYKLVTQLGLQLKYVVNTHVHADHITGSGQLKLKIAADVEAHNKANREKLASATTLSDAEVAAIKADKRTLCQSALAAAGSAAADVQLVHGSSISFGGRKIIGMSTPGHTAGCMSYLLDDASRVFTGDTLLIRGCGRTDFQGGSSKDLYENVHEQLFTLPDSTLVCCAHNYDGHTMSSIGEERCYNPRLACMAPAGPKSRSAFMEIMENLKLPYPKKIDASLPANLKCGL
jgi:sulfur dioxygenase